MLGQTSCGGPLPKACGVFSHECWMKKPLSAWWESLEGLALCLRRALSVHVRNSLAVSDFPCPSTFYFVFYFIFETFV